MVVLRIEEKPRHSEETELLSPARQWQSLESRCGPKTRQKPEVLQTLIGVLEISLEISNKAECGCQNLTKISSYGPNL